MDVFTNLATGFGAAGTLQNLWFALIGCVLGTLIGVLPGIGPIPTIAILLPTLQPAFPMASEATGPVRDMYGFISEATTSKRNSESIGRSPHRFS